MNEKPLYLVMVEAGDNHNKFYRMIPQNDTTFKVEYGRVGCDNFQTCVYPNHMWYTKMNEKLRKGYVDMTDLVTTKTVEKPKSKYADIGTPSIARIVEQLQAMANQAVKDNYTVAYQSVSQKMIDEAQQTVALLNMTNNVESFNEALINLFRIIPRKMQRVADYLASGPGDFHRIIQAEQDLLDVMRGQVVQYQVLGDEPQQGENSTQTILEALGLEFFDIDDSQEEIVKRNLDGLSSKYHKAWKIVNVKTQNAFDNFVKQFNITDTRLLWHGSRNENWWSIINSGLVLRPNAVRTGSMFGHGIYFAPLAQKSFGYTSYSGSYWAGGTSNVAFMSLFNVAYGNPCNVYTNDYRYSSLDFNSLQALQKGTHSLHAHAGQGMLRNDEIIVYKEEQVTIDYLVELH